MSARADAVVIGSGMAGLTAATVLAREGLSVLLCEQHTRYGGYLQRFMVDRTPFDAGCHYVGALGPGEPFDRYLRDLGVRDAIDGVPLDPAGFDVVHLPDRSVPFAVGHDRCAAGLAEAFPGQGAAIGRFVRAVAEEVARFPMYTLAGPLEASVAPSPRTLAEVLSGCGVTDPTLRRVLTAHGLLYFVRPEECPFTLHAFVLDSYLRGAYSIDGGGHALVKALLARFRAHGGVARRRTPVREILAGGRRVRGVRLDDGVVEADTVIAAVDPHAVLGLLPEGVSRPAWRRRVARMTPGLGGFACYARVDADLGAWGRANHFVLGHRGLDPLFDGWDSAPPVWLTVPSARESRWRGPQSVIAMTAVHAARFARWQGSATGARDGAYQQEKQRLGAQVLAAAARVMPPLADQRVSHAVATPLTHRDYTHNAGGAAYGLHHSVDQTGRRGLSWRTPIDGLLLAGHSVLYPGILGATISAFYACGAVVGLDTLHERLRRG